jgi:hypothetical protein
MYLCSCLDAEYIGELIPGEDDKREYDQHHTLFPVYSPESHDGVLSTECCENISA